MPSAAHERQRPSLAALQAGLRLPALCLLVASAYFLLAGVGLNFLSNRVGVAAVWPANGITLAALLLLPRRLWSCVLASGYVGNVLANLLTHHAALESFMFSGVNAVEVLAAGSAMRYLVRHEVRFETTREVILFAVFACAGCGMVGGFLGALCLHGMTGISEPFLGVWLFWSVVDALGMLTITPPIVAAFRHRPFFRSPLRLVEKIACLSLFMAAVFVMFRAGPWKQALLLHMPYVPLLPFLLWAGLRLDVRVSSLLTVILVTVGAWSTLHGHGPFIVEGYTEGREIIAFQMSAILWGMSSLSLSAVTAERRSATAALVASESRARVAEREAIESKARMQAIFVKAEEANRAKTEFLANISHEIRTPLTAILGYTDLMLSPSLSVDQRVHNAQTIRRNGEHLLAILNDVLDMSKIEAGRMTIERVVTSLPGIVAEVMALVEQRAGEKGLTLSVDCHTPIPDRVLSDPTRLRQILMNLIGNAVKFTNHGSVRLVMAVEHVPSGDELVVEVFDTGIGMSPEQVGLLGKPFVQGDPSHVRRFGGSGLGLSICYRLAQLMGGSIACRSQEGGGSTFTLRLPIGNVAGAARMSRLPVVQQGSIGLPSEHDLPSIAGRVLIAEDAADTRRLLMAYLRRTDVEVHTVDNGQAAVAEAIAASRTGHPFDVIVMDVQMPQMDGVTATSVLRSQGYTGAIIALTANAMEHDRARCLAAGCDAFLTKPIWGEAFVSGVQPFLKRGSERVNHDASAVPPAPTLPAGPLVSELDADPEMRDLLDEYVVSLREQAALVEAAVARNDWPTVARMAHQIKGAAGGYGFPSISDAAAAAEQAAKSPGKTGSAIEATDALLALCRRATAGLRC
jgi:signal transduction histidine kinase/CheY-like chemotaxis protein/HPt (histidine-containing phosphotransfer) domain-containing protein